MATPNITKSEICPPDDSEIYDAYELELQSAKGKAVRLGELVTGKGSNITTRKPPLDVANLLHVRHFFCAYDQDYVQTVSQHLTHSILSTLPNPSGPSQIIIVGCGAPALIVPYTTLTSVAFPVYTDPSGKIYETLHMRRTVTGITTPPPYAEKSFLRSLGQALKQMCHSGIFRMLRGGSWKQNGGELIFRGGKCVYMHRMEHVSDHLTAEQLLDILKNDDKAC